MCKTNTYTYTQYTQCTIKTYLVINHLVINHFITTLVIIKCKQPQSGMKCDYLLCFILFQRTLCLVSLDFILSVFLFPDPTVDPDADFYYGKEKN